MIYAVIDTNVFVSALLTKNKEAATFKVTRLLQQGKFKVLYNEDILAEYWDVLSRPKFKFHKKDIETIINYIKEYGVLSECVPFDNLMTDESDRAFYEVSLSKDDAYLVTGNLKHFPATTRVVTPAQMLEILESQPH